MPLRIIQHYWIEKRALREAEHRVYCERSKQLKDTNGIVVLHDVSWIGERRSPRTQDIQLDFIILHPGLRIIVLEVKGGGVSKRDNIWYQRNRQREPVPCIPAPHIQAKENQYKLREKLRGRLEIQSSRLSSTPMLLLGLLLAFMVTRSRRMLLLCALGYLTVVVLITLQVWYPFLAQCKLHPGPACTI